MTDIQTKAIDYLTRIRVAEKVIQQKESELDALRYRASGAGAIRYDKDKVQSSPSSFIEMAMDDIIELSEQIEEDKAGIDEILCNAYSIVRRMDNIEHRTVIELYYIDCLEMKETADRMSTSERNAYYIRDDALESFGTFL